MASRHYRFDRFELHALSRELRDGAHTVALPLKSFDCLVYLIEHRDRAVGRDELISAVWGRADVSDALLGQTLARARRAIGDTGDVQGAIRTVPRFGYHWVKPVTVVERAAAVSVPAAGSAPDVDKTGDVNVDEAASPAFTQQPLQKSRSVRRHVAVIVAALLVFGAAFLALHRHRDESLSDASTAIASSSDMILVLPVAVPAADPSSHWLHLGAMDYLASRVRDRARVPVLPSEQTIAYLAGRSDVSFADPAQRLQFARDVGASRILAARASHTQDGWTFVLDVQDAERTTNFHATADTPLQAADLALGEFFARSGLGAATEPVQRPTVIELQQRIDAAFLDGDLQQASEAIEAAPLDVQKDPAIVVRVAEIDERAGRAELSERGFAKMADGGADIPVEVRARALYGLCATAFHRNELAAAEGRCHAALATLADHPDPMLLGRAHMLGAVIDEKLGRFDAARTGFGLARIEWRRAGNLPGEASVDGNEAMAQSRRGRFAEAIAAFDRATAVFTRFGVQDNLASILSAKSDTQRMMLDLDGALANSTQAWQMTARIGNQMTVRAIGYSHVLALLVNGRLDEAGRILDRFDAGADAAAEFVVLRRQWLAEQGRFKDAIAGADALVDRVLTPTDPGGDERLSGTINMLADAAIDAGDTALAAHLLERLRIAGMRLEDAERPFVADLIQARVSASTGDDPGADSHFAKALDQALQINRPDLIVAAASPYLLFLLARDRIPDASRIAGRLALYADKSYSAARAMAAFHQRVGDRRSADLVNARIPQLAGQRGHAVAVRP